MKSSWYGNLRFSIYGESHAPEIGVIIEGLPVGFAPDLTKLAAFLSRRAPGKNAWSTPRREPDAPEVVSGLTDGRTDGSPLTVRIVNTNMHSKDYEELKYKPRPGHADYTGLLRYEEQEIHPGGGHFSGRMTAPLCILGGLCLQLLEQEGVQIISRIASIGGVQDHSALTESTAEKDFPVVDDACGEKMKQVIADARSENDSVGGVIECAVLNPPAGVGDPMFYGMENRIASLAFGIPAVKGIEFGDGFAAAAKHGSDNNDAFGISEGKVITKTNHCGGILGGITTGEPIVFRIAVKPTPSIAREQDTIDIRTMTETKLTIHGRHDPCIVPRAVPCAEAVAAIALYDALLERRKASNE